jgi:hypothetical protein
VDPSAVFLGQLAVVLCSQSKITNESSMHRSTDWCHRRVSGFERHLRANRAGLYGFIRGRDLFVTGLLQALQRAPITSQYRAALKTSASLNAVPASPVPVRPFTHHGGSHLQRDLFVTGLLQALQIQRRRRSGQISLALGSNSSQWSSGTTAVPRAHAGCVSGSNRDLSSHIVTTLFQRKTNA